MAHQKAFNTGVVIATIALGLRVLSRSLSQSFSLPNVVDLNAWNDVFLVSLQAGVALILIGCFLPNRGDSDRGRGFPIDPDSAQDR